jgi:hypothetical protein
MLNGGSFHGEPAPGFVLETNKHFLGRSALLVLANTKDLVFSKNMVSHSKRQNN